jgi:hypothetical protein
VINHMQFQNGSLHWNIFFARQMHDWKWKYSLLSLSNWQGDEYIICWIPSKRKKYDVKSYFLISNGKIH